MAEDGETIELPNKVVKTKESNLVRTLTLLGAGATLSVIIVFGAGNIIEANFSEVADLTKCITGEYTEGSLFESELKENYDNALIVVHPGYYSTRGDKLSTTDQYQEYLAQLQSKIYTTKESGGLIVYLVPSTEVKNNNLLEGFDYSGEDTLTVVTQATRPLPTPCFQSPLDDLVFQDIANMHELNQILIQKGVQTVSIAGEDRTMCVDLARQLFKGNFETYVDNGSSFSGANSRKYARTHGIR